MKTMPRESRHQELTENPSKPFIDDIEKDLTIINTSYKLSEAKSIKKKMIEAILNDL